MNFNDAYLFQSNLEATEGAVNSLKEPEGTALDAVSQYFIKDYFKPFYF